MNEASDSPVYQERLVQIFESCDSGNKGYLSLLEFERLCRQLHLDHHKQRLYRDLGLDRTSITSQVYFDNFQEVFLSLLQEVGAESLTTVEQTSLTDNSESQEPRSRRRNGRGSQTSSEDDDLHLNVPHGMTADDSGFAVSSEKGQRKLRTSPPSPLKRAFLEDDGDGSQLLAGKHRKADDGQVETFEAEGQLAVSPEPSDLSHGLDSDTGLEQLRHVCSRLGVGRHGYLTQGELGRVCQFIGMEQMDEEELQELFDKLDMDRDGYISFDEFVSGLSHHSSSRSNGTPTVPQPLRPLSARKVRTPLPPSQQDRGTSATYMSGDTVSLFSAVESSFTGFSHGEDIIDYWESLGVPNGNNILVSLGFNPHTKIYLKELSSCLISEWAGQILNHEDNLGHALSTTYQNELAYLRSTLDQTSEERDKLRLDLTDALSRNALLATEVDERHAQLERSYEARLQSLEQSHLEQTRSLQTQLEKEKESQSSQSAILRQTSEQIQGLQQQVTSLQDKLTTTQTDAASAAKDLMESQEKQGEWEQQYQRLKREVQQQQQQNLELDSPSSLSWEQEKKVVMEKAEWYAAENKELKDRNDELVAQLEDLQQRFSSGHRRGSTGSQNRGGPAQSRIPVYTRANSISSLTSETETSVDDDDLLSSFEGFFYNRHNRMAATEEHGEKAPSLSSELQQQQQQQQQQRMMRGERRERERKEIEHAYRLEISELEDRYQAEKFHILDSFEKEKSRMSEDFQGKLMERLAEQQRELQNAFTMEKQDLLEQYESRLNLQQVQHNQQIRDVAQRAKQEAQEEMQQSQNQSTDTDRLLQEMRELKEEKGELEKRLDNLLSRYEAELQKHRIKSEQQLAETRASVMARVEDELQNIFSEGVSALEGKLKEDFHRLLQQQQQHQQQQHDNHAPADNVQDTEQLYALFEREKLSLVNQYESQIVSLQKELESLRQDFEAERTAYEQIQSGDLAQTIRQEMQDEMGRQMDQLRQSWEEERQELAVQNQLLEEELADMKGLLTQERQRAAEAHMLRETVRRLRAENKEVECTAESLKEKLARGHQQQESERATFERRIDELEREKERALRLQALQNAGPGSAVPASADEKGQKEVLEPVIQQVEAVHTRSPEEQQMEQGTLDQLHGEMMQLNHQLQEARTAQFEFQQLREECALLRQSNTNLEETVRTLRQRTDKAETERKREEQDQMHDLWEEKKKLQNLLQRTTDKLLKTSAEMAAGQTHLVREVEQLKQKAGNMVELQTFTRLQVSLLETQRHAISLQEALMERTQLADKIMAEAEKERLQEREAWEEEKLYMLGRLDATTDMYRSLAVQHKQLRHSATKLGALVKDLYVENADLMCVLQQTEGKQRAAERKCRKLQERCQAWHDAVYRMYRGDSLTGE